MDDAVSVRRPALSSRQGWARFVLLFCVAMLAVFLAPPDPFLEALPTAVATLLLFAVAIVLAMRGAVGVGGFVSGFEPGAAIAFFLRQIHDSPRLAPGAERVLFTSSLVWLTVVVVRWWRSRL